MTPEEIKQKIGENELEFSTSRSSGPGGQNVNKVNTKVELRFNVPGSSLFNETEKQTILEKLKNRISNEGDLLIVCQSERTQLQNRKKVVETFYILLAKALTKNPRRIATKPTGASRAKRLDEKKNRSRLKSIRRNIND